MAAGQVKLNRKVYVLFGQQEETDWNAENIDWNKIDSQLISQRILVTRPEINGKRLASLRLRNHYGINISRVYRSGVQLLAQFIPLTAPTWTVTAFAYLYQILYLGVFYNIAFAIFNLIPVPPLDGSRLLYAFLPSKSLLWFQRYEQYFMWGLLGIFLVFNLLNINIIGKVTLFFVNLLFKLFFI